MDEFESRIDRAIEHRLPDAGEETRRSLTTLGREVWENCWEEILQGSDVVRERFLRLYSQVSHEAPLRTTVDLDDGIGHPEIKDRYLRGRDELRIWQLVTTPSGRDDARVTGEAVENVALKLHLRGIENVEIQSGGVKSQESVRREIKERQAWDKAGGFGVLDIRDIIRGRAVGESLWDVENVIERLAGERGVFRRAVVSCFNTYDRLFPDLNDLGQKRPYLACNLTVAVSQELPYELQIMTRRGLIAGNLTHPLPQLDWAALPADVRDHIRAFAWGAYILDYEEFLGGATHTED